MLAIYSVTVVLDGNVVVQSMFFVLCDVTRQSL